MSLTISSLIGILALKILEWMGVKIGPEQLNEFIQTGGTIILGIIAWWGRFRKKDIKWWGGRKPVDN